MYVVLRALKTVVPFCLDVPIPRPFGRAAAPVGSVPRKRLRRSVGGNCGQLGVVGESITDRPLRRKPLMARFATSALQFVTTRPSPSTVPRPLISMSGPSAFWCPKKPACVAPSILRFDAVSGGSGVLILIVFHGLEEAWLIWKAIAHSSL